MKSQFSNDITAAFLSWYQNHLISTWM